MDSKDLGRVTGSREPSQSSVSRPIGFDPARDRVAHLLLPFLTDEMTFAQARILADQLIREVARDGI